MVFDKMEETAFLKKMKKESKIALVEPSEEIKESYIKKAEDCLKSAKILFESQLYENSTSEAYYSMYNSLLALLFKTGVKSENHSASIILFKKLFNNNKMVEEISFAKGERIDKQYYVEAQQIIKATKESCKTIINLAEGFIIKMKTLILEINNEIIRKARVSFEDIFKEELERA